MNTTKIILVISFATIVAMLISIPCIELSTFLIFDNVSQNEYIMNGTDSYTCTSFVCDLCDNLDDAGYNCGMATIIPTDGNIGHAMVWCEIYNGEIYIIESITDQVYTHEQTAKNNPNCTITYENMTYAYEARDEMYAFNSNR